MGRESVCIMLYIYAKSTIWGQIVRNCLKKNGMSAVFDMDGKQLTDFVPGSFCWKWAEIDEYDFDPCNMKRTIFNGEAKIKLPPR